MRPPMAVCMCFLSFALDVVDVSVISSNGNQSPCGDRVKFKRKLYVREYSMYESCFTLLIEYDRQNPMIRAFNKPN
jgi:hypothetical protein